MVKRDSLCEKCDFGHTFQGLLIHRTATLQKPKGPDWGVSNFSYDDDDEEEEDQELPESISVQQNYSETTSGQCFFPHIPKDSPPQFEAIPLTDCVVTSCNRYQEFEV